MLSKSHELLYPQSARYRSEAADRHGQGTVARDTLRIPDSATGRWRDTWPLGQKGLDIMKNTYLAALGLCAAVLPAAPGKTAEQPATNTEWKLLGGNPEMWHYSPLAAINEKTVASLGLAWYTDLPTREGTVGNPLVADGVVYQSGAMSAVFAIDLRTGKLLWQFAPKLDYQRDFVGLWAIRTNRGLALWNDKVIVGTGDCRVIALDRKTGKSVWDVKSCNPAESVGITG